MSEQTQHYLRGGSDVEEELAKCVVTHWRILLPMATRWTQLGKNNQCHDAVTLRANCAARGCRLHMVISSLFPTGCYLVDQKHRPTKHLQDRGDLATFHWPTATWTG